MKRRSENKERAWEKGWKAELRDGEMPTCNHGGMLACRPVNKHSEKKDRSWEKKVEGGMSEWRTADMQSYGGTAAEPGPESGEGFSIQPPKLYDHTSLRLCNKLMMVSHMAFFLILFEFLLSPIGFKLHSRVSRIGFLLSP